LTAIYAVRKSSRASPHPRFQQIDFDVQCAIADGMMAKECAARRGGEGKGRLQPDADGQQLKLESSDR